MTRNEFITSVAAVPFIGKLVQMNKNSYSMKLINPSANEVHQLQETLATYKNIELHAPLYPHAVLEMDGKVYHFQGYPEGHTEVWTEDYHI